MIVTTNFLFSRKLGIGEYFGVKSDEAKIELKEMGGVDAARFRDVINDMPKAIEYFVSKLPDIIVDHDFWKDEANKLTADELAAIIAAKAELCMSLMSRYAQEVLFTHGKKSEEK